MSSAPDYSSISTINFTGGFPTSGDLALSIIFLIVYAVSIPIMAWRLFRKQDRCLMLIRPSLFLACRLGMLGLRAYMAKNTYGEGELIAELILVSIGYLFLIEPVITCWKRAVALAAPADEAPGWVRRLSILVKVLLLTAIGTAIGGASSISSALDDPSKLNTVVKLRETSAILSLAVAVVLLIALVLTTSTFGLDMRKSAYLFVLDCCLIVISVYRVVQIYSKDPHAAVRSRAAFWILQMLFELIVYAGLLAVSLPTWFPKEGSQPANDVEMGRQEVKPNPAYGNEQQTQEQTYYSRR